jgi:hypothetical protein
MLQMLQKGKSLRMANLSHCDGVVKKTFSCCDLIESFCAGTLPSPV